MPPQAKRDGPPAADDSDSGIVYEPDEKTSLSLTAAIALQGVLLTTTTTALAMSLFANAAEFDSDYRTWTVIAAIIVNGIVTTLQSARVGLIGGGHNLIVGTAPSFIAIALLALDKAGPQTLSLLIVVSSLIQFALARWLPRARQIITPVVGGIVVMLIAASVMQVAVGRLAHGPADTPSYYGPLVAAVTLALAAVLGLRARGKLRLFSPLVGILAACALAAVFGLYDPSEVADAAWIALPDPQPPGIDLTPGAEFWSLLPMFLVVSMAAALNSMTSNVVVQQNSWRSLRVPDFRLVQGAMNANGLGALLGGLAGTLPTTTYGATSVALTNMTGVASRRVGYGVGVILVVLALAPKAMAVLVSVPDAVTAGYLLFIMGMLFVEGLRTVAQDGLQRHKALIVGVSLSVGVALRSGNAVGDLIHGAWGTLLADGMMLGTITAIGLTAFSEVAARRRERLEVDLHIDSLPRIGEFLESLAVGAKWNEASVSRLRLVGEEALTSLLDARGGGDRSRLIVMARTSASSAELQFLAVLEEQNLEEQMAYLSDQVETPEERTISLQLLRHFASTVRHRKYSGIDIVTVEVEQAR